MPIYAFKCPEHGETERLLPMAEAGQDQACHCGRIMTRLFSPPSVRVPKGTREVVLDTLNREHRGARTRDAELMAAGLEEPPRRAFGGV